MGDLYHRLKQIRESRTTEKTKGRALSPGDAARTGNAQHHDPNKPQEISSLGPEWHRCGAETYRRVTEYTIDPTRYGDRFDSDRRWRSISPLTGITGGHTPVFLDIETSGLSAGAGSVAFLIGIGVPVCDSRAIEVTQLFLNELGYEGALLDALDETLHGIPDPMYVTYNGGSFDLPVLRSRHILNRRRFPETAHFDLLHITRRLYAPVIGSCSLGSVETHVLGNGRIGDVSGYEAPERYLSYLRTRDREILEPIFLHHLRDIAHLSEVGLAINGVLLDRIATQLPPDPVALARLLLDRGRTREERSRGITMLQEERIASEARRRRVFEASRRALGRTRGRESPTVQAWARVRELLADELRRNGDLEGHYELAQELYQFRDHREDLVRLTKVLEHTRHEYDRALSVIDEWCSRYRWDDDLRHRYERIERKRAKRTKNG